jgi:hypothetical protein
VKKPVSKFAFQVHNLRRYAAGIYGFANGDPRILIFGTDYQGGGGACTAVEFRRVACVECACVTTTANAGTENAPTMRLQM